MSIRLALAPALAVAVFSTAHTSGTSVRLTTPVPSVIRQGDALTLRGAVRSSGRNRKAVLESKRADGWVMLANTKISKRGTFALSWTVPKSDPIGPISLRVAVLRRRKVLAVTAPVQSVIGPQAKPCAAPVPPAVEIPAGDGWIVGGAIGEGGPFPGFYACLSQPYTITATDSSGNLQATQNVQGGHSYTLAPLPAGQYTLAAGACHGTASVTAGQQTTANSYCYYP